MIKINHTEIKGVYEFNYSCYEDNRGSFLNYFRSNEDCFKNTWGDRKISQINISFNKTKGSIRGMHYQDIPHEEAKIISCLDGEIWDVVLDLRPKSVTYGKWLSFNLSLTRKNAVMIPEGCAHGFQTLKDNSRIIYFHSGSYAPDYENGVRWNDENLNILWPLKVTEISAKDSNLPLFKKT